MSNILKKVIMLITWIPKWILEVLGIKKPEIKEVANVKRKKLPKPLDPNTWGRAIFLIEKCIWPVNRAVKEVGIPKSTFTQGRRSKPKECKQAIKAYIKMANPEILPPPTDVYIRKGRSHEQEIKLGHTVWLLENDESLGSVVKEACKVSELGPWTYSTVKRHNPGLLQEAKKTFMKSPKFTELTKGKAKKATKAPKASKVVKTTKAAKGTRKVRKKAISKVAFGRVVWLVQECGWPVRDACRDEGKCGDNTFQHYKNNNPAFMKESLKTYLKKVGKGKLKELPPTPSIGKPSTPAIVWGEVKYLIEVKGMAKAKACRKLDVGYTTYVSVNKRKPGYLDDCLEAYLEKTGKSKAKKLPPASSPRKFQPTVASPSLEKATKVPKKAKTIKLKALSAKSRGRSKVTEPKLTKAQLQRKSELRPEAAWERLTDALLYQMVDLLTPKQACRKAGIEFSTYLEYKELDVNYKEDSFKILANDAEQHRVTGLVAKKEQGRNK